MDPQISTDPRMGEVPKGVIIVPPGFPVDRIDSGVNSGVNGAVIKVIRASEYDKLVETILDTGGIFTPEELHGIMR